MCSGISLALTRPALTSSSAAESSAGPEKPSICIFAACLHAASRLLWWYVFYINIHAVSDLAVSYVIFFCFPFFTNTTLWIVPCTWYFFGIKCNRLSLEWAKPRRKGEDRHSAIVCTTLKLTFLNDYARTGSDTRLFKSTQCLVSYWTEYTVLSFILL